MVSVIGRAALVPGYTKPRAGVTSRRLACFGCTEVRMESRGPPLWTMAGGCRECRWWRGRVVWGSSAW